MSFDDIIKTKSAVKNANGDRKMAKLSTYRRCRIARAAAKRATLLANKQTTDLGLPDSKQTGAAPFPHKNRKRCIKQESGGVLALEIAQESGYRIPVASESSDKLLDNVDFNDTYRNDPTRILEEKTKYPIASIQVLSRRSNRRSRRSNLGYSQIIPPYTKFFLTGVQTGSREKYQLHHTFRSFRLSFFDEQPEIWNFSGILLNSERQNWATEFRVLYKRYLRGTECAKNKAQVYISFEDTIISGLMVNMGQTFNSQNNNGVPVTFQVIITNETYTSSSEIINSALRKGVDVATGSQPAAVFRQLRKNFIKAQDNATVIEQGLVVDLADRVLYNELKNKANVTRKAIDKDIAGQMGILATLAKPSKKGQ